MEPDRKRDQGELVLGEDGAEEMAERDPYALVEPTVLWRGLPAFEPGPPREIRLVFSFDTDEERDELIARLGVVIAKKTKGTWSAWWPPRERDDLSSLLFRLDDPGRVRPLVEGWKLPEDVEPATERLRWDAPVAWAEHLGHLVALEYGADGALVGARCSDCGVPLPDPDR